MKVTKQMRTETAHRLAGHPARCNNLHGHSYLWEVTIEGAVDENSGMVLDFSTLKQVMMLHIDPFDHALVVELDDEDSLDMQMVVLIKEHEPEARIIITPYRPTAENMALWVAAEIEAELGNLFKVTVKLWETATSYAEVTA